MGFHKEFKDVSEYRWYCFACCLVFKAELIVTLVKLLTHLNIRTVGELFLQCHKVLANRLSMLCNQPNIAQFTQVKYFLHFSVFALVSRCQILLYLRHCRLEDVSSWFVVFVHFADEE